MIYSFKEIIKDDRKWLYAYINFIIDLRMRDIIIRISENVESV